MVEASSVSGIRLANPARQAADLRSTLDDARQDRRPLYDAERVQTAMEAHGIDAVIASSAANVTYTGGAWVPHPLLLSFVVTTSGGEQGVVINEADEFYFNEYSWIRDIRGFRFGPNAAADALSLLRGLLTDLGLERARLGVELTALSRPALERVEMAAPDAAVIDATNLFEHARLVKTPAERELLRIAAYNSDKAIQTAFALTRPGDTEKSLASRMQSNALLLGADATGHTHVHAGTHSTVVHTLSIERPIAAGEVVHVDFGAVFAGYVSDISRNAVALSPSPRQREIYAHLVEIERILIDRLRPGTRASEIFELAQSEFARRHLVHPWGTLGHSIGLSVHEGFEFAANSESVLEPGMVVCVEPSHIEQRDARYHVEDTVIVTDDGPDVISNFAPIDEIFIIA
jgi:Xaa-Pro aminopeptidase